MFIIHVSEIEIAIVVAANINPFERLIASSQNHLPANPTSS